ncbi:CbtB domain-containing protein [Litoreibacter janthinus]|uniref:Cobalt transporter subunit CbtB n=1 Tax=Litoreibacter janthinus TaxID=670154 RepID=A0A1I6FU02_9RHOB|nr:cobalt transporter subunit CbtB [Litoreibacter janthinus]
MRNETPPVGCDGAWRLKMKNEAKVATLNATAAQTTDMSLVGILGAAALGMALLFAAGFAQASVMHDTAHDQRHAMAFPCH